jgi:hypothetical protein
MWVFEKESEGIGFSKGLAVAAAATLASFSISQQMALTLLTKPSRRAH